MGFYPLPRTGDNASASVWKPPDDRFWVLDIPSKPKHPSNANTSTPAPTSNRHTVFQDLGTQDDLLGWPPTYFNKRAPCCFRSKGHATGLSMTLYPAYRCLPAAAVFLLVHIASVLAEFREGDVVPMSYMSKFTGASVEGWETPWDEALRSQMPRYGRPGKIPFNPALPDYSSQGKLAVALAFSKERFVLPRVTVREAGEGSRLSGLVLTFVYAAGDIVRVRSDTVYGKMKEDDDGSHDFDIEYRWDRLPEEDEQAGIWLIFAVSLIVTVFLAVDVCNSPSGEPESANRSRDDGGTRAGRSSGVRTGDERRRR